MIAIAQTSVELDAVYFPFNKRSTQREPQYWMGELGRQGVSHAILGKMRINITAPIQDTVRAKKAVVCLYYVSGVSMEEIERAMNQFGGAFDGAAGPIRSVTGRTCDVLPMIARAAEILHGGIDLQLRYARLLIRLDLGIQGPAVDLARYTGRALDRGDYRRLCEARLTEREALTGADNRTLMRLFGNDVRKVALVQEALERWRVAGPLAPPAAALPEYQQ